LAANLPDSDVVDAVREVGKTIIVVLAVVQVRGEVAVVDPDVLGLLDANGIALALGDLADSQVLDDDVLGLLDEQAGADDLGVGVLAENGLVAAHADLVNVALESAFDPDSRWLVALHGVHELLDGLDRHLRATGTTSGTAVCSER
jgi:hypothetical protein